MREAYRFVDMGGIDPIATQAVYEAVAVVKSRKNVPDTLIICWPRSPLVCVGYFQEVDREVDVEYCGKKKIPIVRRILGGGAVYLDSNQVFYQIVGQKGGKIVPFTVKDVFRRLLEAPVKVYEEIGIHAVYRPINDIEVEGRKISGTGAGEIDGATILTGNIILDFNYDEMAKILKVPDEKFRDKLVKSLRDRVTTVKRELAQVPSHQKIEELLVKHYEETLGVEFTVGHLTREEQVLLEKLKREKYLTKQWTYENADRHPQLSRSRTIKISGRSVIGQGVYKSLGGLIRVAAEFMENKIGDILISGDFTFLPSHKISELEKNLVGAELDEQVLTNAIAEFCEKNRTDSPGTTPSDFTKAILIAGGVIRQ